MQAKKLKQTCLICGPHFKFYLGKQRKGSDSLGKMHPSDLQWVLKDSSQADTSNVKPDNLGYSAELETVSAFSCCEQSALLLSGSSVSICQPVRRALPLV